MPGVQVSISGGVIDTLFGKYQHPIRTIIEQTAGVADDDSQIKQLFNMIDGGKQQTVSFGGITALGLFEPRGELSPHPQDGFQETPTKDLTYTHWAKKLVISEDAVMFARFGDIKSKATQFTNSFYVTREEFASRYYGEATQGHGSFKVDGIAFDLTTNDKKPLFDTAHPSSVKPSKTQSNAFSNDFSVEALGLAAAAAQKFEGDTGNRLGIKMDTIIIPNDAALIHDVFAALGSYQSPNDSSNAFNFQFGRWNVVVMPNLDKYIASGAKPWMLLDSRYLTSANAAVWGDWDKGLRLTSDFDNELRANVWRGDAMYGATFIDWRFVCCGGIPGATVLS
jgi:hypothetical protein